MARNEYLQRGMEPGGSVRHWVRENGLAVCGISAQWEGLDDPHKEGASCKACLGLLTMRVEKDAENILKTEAVIAFAEYAQLIGFPDSLPQAADEDELASTVSNAFLEWFKDQPAERRQEWRAKAMARAVS